MEYTREEIRFNRQKWIDYLKRPETKKVIGVLESALDNEARCCLGHACHVLNLERVVEMHPERRKPGIFYGTEHNRDSVYMPQEGINMLGLWNRQGGTPNKLIKISDDRYFISLSMANDSTSDISPQDIGNYLQSVIEGGENTPFRPLSQYPETV